MSTDTPTGADVPSATPDDLPEDLPCDCRQRRDECRGCNRPLGMWDDELRSPLRAAAMYIAVLLAALIGSHIQARGGL